MHNEPGSLPSERAAAPRGESGVRTAPPRFTLDRIIRVLLGVAVAATAVWLLWYFSTLVIYLLVGLVLAYLMRPIVDRFQGIGLGRRTALAVTFLLFAAGLAVLVRFMVPFVGRQVADITQQASFESKVQVTAQLPSTAGGRSILEVGDLILSIDGQTVRDVDQVVAALRGKQDGDTVQLRIRNEADEEREVSLSLGHSIDAPESAPQAEEVPPVQGEVIEPLGLAVRTLYFSDVITSIEERLSKIVPVQKGVFTDAVTGVFQTLFQEDRLTRLMGSVVGFFTDIFYAVIIIPFVAFFALKDGAMIRRTLLQLVPNRYFEITLSLIEKVESNLGRYFRGLLMQSLSIGTLATILLTVIGLQSALAVGIFAGLANTIPYFGPLMGFLAGTLMGIAQTGDFSLVPGVLIAMGLTQVADNVLFQPLIFSRAARAHPLVILFVVLIGAQLGGIIGMLIAIPLMTIIRVTFEQVLWSLRNYRILRAAR